MGQEIAHCSTCGTRLRSVDFDKGQAFRFTHHNYCAKCVPPAILAAAPPPPAKAAPAPAAPRPAPLPPPPASKPVNLPLVAVGIVVVVLIGVGWFLGRGSASEPPAPAGKRTPPPPPPVEDPRRKLQETIASDFAAVDAELRTLEARETFQAALSFLATARGRHLVPEWTKGIDARVSRVNETADKLFAGLQAEAVAARKAGAEGKVGEISARVAKWDQPRYAAQLQQTLAAVPKPAPPPPPKPPSPLSSSPALKCDFSSDGAVFPLWQVRKGDYPVTFSGLAEFTCTPTKETWKPTALNSYSKFVPPFRIAVDVEFTHRDPKSLFFLRLHAYKDGQMVKALHADTNNKYNFYVPGVTSQICDAPPPGRREQWTIDVAADGTATWSVDGKELLRVPGVTAEAGFSLIFEMKGTADPAARVRLRNVMVEYPKR